MQPRIHRIGAAVAIALGAAALAPVAAAQQPPLHQPQAPAQQAAPTPPADTGPAPTGAELQNFAGAAKDVENIRQRVQPQIETAKTPAPSCSRRPSRRWRSRCVTTIYRCSATSRSRWPPRPTPRYAPK